VAVWGFPVCEGTVGTYDPEPVGAVVVEIGTVVVEMGTAVVWLIGTAVVVVVVVVVVAAVVTGLTVVVEDAPVDPKLPEDPEL
jgi:hypothetical protein